MNIFSGTWLENEAEHIPRERALLEGGQYFADAKMQFATKVTGKKWS